MPVSRRSFLKNSPALPLAAGGAAAQAPSESKPPTSKKSPRLEKKHQGASGRDFYTELMHLGEEEGFSSTSIHQAKNVRGRYQRPQVGNPTLIALETKMCALEGAADCATGGTGMAAISETVLGLCSAGDRIVAHKCVYGTTDSLFRNYLPRWGITVDWVDFQDLDQLRDALKQKTRMIWWESYVNPTMETLDGPSIIRLAKDAGALSVTDNTFLSPYLFQPLRYGGDLSIHAATKYISGHGNAMGGVVCGSKELIAQVRNCIVNLGGQMRPFDAYMITQGMKTLGLRMERCCDVAQTVAEYFERHPAVARIRYGGLSSWTKDHPGTKFVKGWGGMMGIEWKDEAVAQNFTKKVKMAKPWASLGDVVTLVINQGPQPERRVPGRYTRVSIGLEDPADIIADFEQAIAAAQRTA